MEIRIVCVHDVRGHILRRVGVSRSFERHFIRFVRLFEFENQINVVYFERTVCFFDFERDEHRTRTQRLVIGIGSVFQVVIVRDFDFAV